MSGHRPLPLAGLRVLDLTGLGPGPFMTQCVREMGAHVVKVERPPHGDLARAIAPGAYKALNTGKEALWLDLKQAGASESLLAQVESFDVLVEGFRPGVADRLGLGYRAVSAVNPKIIYVSISGFGQRGPSAHRPGHDVTYLAASGFLSLTGAAEHSSGHVIGVPIADFYAALYGLSACLAAVHSMRNGAGGRYLDVSITACMVHVTNAVAAEFRHAGVTAPAAQRRNALVKPGYGVFRTLDNRLIAIGAIEDHFWEALVDVLGLDCDGLHTATYSERAANAEALNARIASAISLLSGQETLRALAARDVPFSDVIDPLAVGDDLARFVDIDGLRSACFPVDFERG